MRHLCTCFLMAGIVGVLVQCHTKDNEAITYRSYDHRYHPSNEQLVRLSTKFDELRKPQPETLLTFDSSWLFISEDASEHVVAGRVLKGIWPVLLPHRIQLPDHALWYSRQVFIPEPGYLSIQADDGAQLFIHEKQVLRKESIYFPVDTSGTVSVSIRVLNNAMAGGLTNVSFMTKEKFQDYQRSLKQYLRIKQLVEKALLLTTISSRQLTSVENLLDHPDEPSLTNAEAAFAGLPYLVGPWISRLDSDSYRLHLFADSTEKVILRYGAMPEQLTHQQEQQGGLVTFVLEPVTSPEIFYQLTSGNTRSPVYHFTVTERDSFSFNVWGDSQSGWEKFQRHLSHARTTDDAFGVAAGDLVNNGADREEWRMLFNVLSISSPYRPYYLVAGNHDHDGYYDDLIPHFYRQFTRYPSPDYFAWKYSNCAFIALNPNLNFPVAINEDSDQYKWFRAQLESKDWKAATWRFIILHQAIYSQGWEGYHGDQALREMLEPMIESAKIDFIISGHTHDYERLTKNYGDQRTTYMITGGAGGSLEPDASSEYPKMDTVIKSHHFGRFIINGARLKFEAIDIHNNRIDSFKIQKPNPQ